MIRNDTATIEQEAEVPRSGDVEMLAICVHHLQHFMGPLQTKACLNLGIVHNCDVEMRGFVDLLFLRDRATISRRRHCGRAEGDICGEG